MAQAGHAYSQVDQPPGRIAIGRVERGQQPGGVRVGGEQSHRRHWVDASASGACRADGEQLRPLFSFFQAITLTIGVYASEADFDNYRIVSEPLKARIRLAAERAAPLFGGRSELLKIA